MEVKDADGSSPVSRASKPAPPWLGRRVGRFKLLAMLGKGAMGKVYRAEDVSLQRQVALKILPLKIKLGNKIIGLEQFVREARSAAAIDHPGVVQIYEVNQQVDVFYIAMELLEGGNLSSLIKAGGPMDAIRACQLGAEAAEALGHAHALGIVHRDVKPANLMLSRSGRCKLTDFGLARIDDPNDSYALGTESVGTPLYMAPEVIEGEPATSASDIYSLAATMCFLLCGRPPYQGKTSKQVLAHHVNAPLPDLLSWRADLPRGLADTVCRGLAKKPRDRFASAEQFASALRVHTIPVSASGAFPSGSMPAGSGATTPAASPRGRSRNGILIGASAAATLLAALGIAYLFWPTTPPLPALPAPVLKPAVVLPAAILSSGKLQATDTAFLTAIATDPKNPLYDRKITVVGIASEAHSTSSDNMRILFKGVDVLSGFQVFCPQELLMDMQTRFGGDGGTNLVGKTLSVHGVVKITKKRLQIKIESADQISVIK